MDVGPATPAETAAVLAVVQAAFGDEGPAVAGLVRALVEEGGTSGALRVSLVARGPRGQVAGHVALTRGWLDADRRLVELAVLSPLSVRPDLQRRGVGRHLVEAAVAEADRLEVPPGVLRGDPRHYRRLGCEPGIGTRSWTVTVDI